MYKETGKQEFFIDTEVVHWILAYWLSHSLCLISILILAWICQETSLFLYP